MRVVQIMNWHRFGGGSDFMARVTADVLRAQGHDVLMMTSESSSFDASVVGKVRACVRGMYSVASRREMREIIQQFVPDVVHVHEVYPAHSPWVLRDCKAAGIPVAMTCHDFRVTCPVATHLHAGRPCEDCTNGSTMPCFKKNCRGNRLESAAYAARAGVARAFNLFEDNVDVFMTPSRFVQQKLVASGLPEARVRVVPNMVKSVSTSVDPASGRYAAYAGRIAPEKGIDTLLEAAWRTALPLHIAGHATRVPNSVAPNVQWLGHLSGQRLHEFYAGARFVVVPSLWYEAFGLVVAEAMMLGIPVIAAASGALPELVEHGVTGFLFNAGDAQDLARLMATLWKDAELCRRFGEAARARAIERYTEGQYYTNLIAAYKAAANHSTETASAARAKSRRPQVV